MRQTFLIVTVICAIAINVLLGIAIYPHLQLIGTVASWVAADILLCIGVVFPVATFFFLRWLWFHSSTVRRGEVVVSYHRGPARLLSAEHEAAKLQLPAPVTVTEEREDGDEVLIAKVRLFHDVGYSIQRIATETGLKPWKVQRWTSEYERTKKAKGQSQAGQLK